MGGENEILEHAMIETEKEIFGEGFDKDEVTLDHTGDQSLETMGEGLEGQHEANEDDDEADVDLPVDGKDGKEPELKGEGKEPPKPEPEPAAREGRVPAGRLREQTEKARAAESERDALKAQLETSQAQSRKDVDALNAKFEAALAMMQRQQPQQQAEVAPKVEEPPDLFEDPKGFAEYMQRGFRSELQQRDKAMEDMRVETSLQVAHARHGEIFGQAFDAVKGLDAQNPDNRELVRKLYTSPNPGEALVQWHKRNEVLKQVGDDPVKFREQAQAAERERLMKDPEFRRQIIDDLRAEAETGDNGRARTTTNLPRSLGRATGASSHVGDRVAMDDSDSSIFGSIFSNG